MRRTCRLTYLFVFAASLAGLACEKVKREEQVRDAPPTPKVVAPPGAAAKATAWYEGAFQGKAGLAPAGDGSRPDGPSAPAEAAPTQSGDPVVLHVNVTLNSEGLQGTGEFGAEAISLTGTSDEKEVRLLLLGDSVRGTFVGHGDEQTKSFQGVVRLSRTETHEGKVRAEAFLGEFVLEGGK